MNNTKERVKENEGMEEGSRGGDDKVGRGEDGEE